MPFAFSPPRTGRSGRLLQRGDRADHSPIDFLSTGTMPGFLRPMWERIDRTCFDGTLAPVELRWAANLGWRTVAATQFRQGKATVLVDRQVAFDLTRLHDMLLHEAVHVSVGLEPKRTLIHTVRIDEHGPRFAAEAARVAALLGWPAPKDLKSWPESQRWHLYASGGTWREVS